MEFDESMARDLLGLPPAPAVVSGADVYRAFRRQALETHPDKRKNGEMVEWERLVDAKDQLLVAILNRQQAFFQFHSKGSTDLLFG